MRRTLPLIALLAACGGGLAYGLPAATGSTETAPTVEHLDTTDHGAEPTGRTYLPASPTQPATGSAAPSSSAVPAPAVTRAPASAVTAVEAPAPAAVTSQPVRVAEPAPEPSCAEGEEYDGERCVAQQLPEERIGGYRCPDPTAVVVAIDETGAPLCGVQ